MKVSIKKIKSLGLKEWLILVNKRTIATAFTKDDAKFLVKCIRRYKKE